MSENVQANKGERMDDVDVKLLQAIHKVEKKVVGLETKIDESVNGRFKDHERRLEGLESNQRWVILAVIGAVIGAVLQLIIK